MLYYTAIEVLPQLQDILNCLNTSSLVNLKHVSEICKKLKHFSKNLLGKQCLQNFKAKGYKEKTLCKKI